MGSGECWGHSGTQVRSRVRSTGESYSLWFVQIKSSQFFRKPCRAYQAHLPRLNDTWHDISYSCYFLGYVRHSFHPINVNGNGFDNIFSPGGTTPITQPWNYYWRIFFFCVQSSLDQFPLFPLWDNKNSWDKNKKMTFFFSPGTPRWYHGGKLQHKSGDFFFFRSHHPSLLLLTFQVALGGPFSSDVLTSKWHSFTWFLAR